MSPFSQPVTRAVGAISVRKEVACRPRRHHPWTLGGSHHENSIERAQPSTRLMVLPHHRPEDTLRKAATPGHQIVPNRTTDDPSGDDPR